MVNPNPKFSWSAYRERMFNECELCYALYYYGSHLGWQAGQEQEVYAAYRWKKAKSLPQYMHERLGHRIKYGFYSFNLKGIADQVKDDLREAVKGSINHKEQWYREPNRQLMLQEFVYKGKEALKHPIVSQTMKDLELMAKNFYASATTKEILDKKGQLIPMDKWQDSGFPYFKHPRLNDMRIYINPNVVVHKNENDKTVATIFKTDTKKSSINETGGIALFLRDALNVHASNIIVRDVFLPTGQHFDHTMDDNVIEMMLDSISNTVFEMSSILENDDWRKNKFVGFKNVKLIRNSSHNANESNETCSYCECVRRDLELFPDGYDEGKMKSILSGQEPLVGA